MNTLHKLGNMLYRTFFKIERDKRIEEEVISIFTECYITELCLLTVK